MNKIFVIYIITLIFFSCDPVSQMEADITNLTSQDHSISFISSETDLNRTVQVNTGQTVLFQEGFDVGSTYLQPSLMEYDSVIIRNQAEAVLKIYKENDSGKNIYGIEDYWSASEPSKRFFKYEYQIEATDVE